MTPRMLIVHHWGEGYIQIDDDWVHAIMKLAPDALVLDFWAEYRRIGPRSFYELLPAYIDKHGVTTILFIHPPLTEATPRLLEGLRRRCYIAAYFGNYAETGEHWSRYFAQACDLAILDSFYHCHQLRLYGIDALFLPTPFSPERYRPLGLRRDIDISFVGCCGKQGRRRYLDALVRQGYHVETFGLNSENGVISHDEMVRVFNRTKINLNFSGLDSIHNRKFGFAINNRVKQAKGRCQEVSMTRSFVLTEGAPDLRHVFDIGRHIAVFRDEAELLERVRFYLDNEAERDRIAAAAYDYSCARYDNRVVWKDILGRIEERRAGKIYAPSELHLDGIFTEFVARQRLVNAARFSRSGRPGLVVEELGLIAAEGGFRFSHLAEAAKELAAPIFKRHPRFKAALRRLLRREPVPAVET